MAVPDVIVHAADKHWAMGGFDQCLIVIWRGGVTADALRQIGDRLTVLTQQRPGNCAYLNVLERDAPPPPPSLRKLAMADIARAGKALSCMAAAIEGNEFRAVFARAVMTGMVLLSAPEQPAKFFKTVADMSKWVQGQLRDTGDLDKRIVLATESLREEMPK